MNQAHVVVYGSGQIFLRKLQGSHLARSGENTVLVFPLPINGGGRGAQVDAQDVVGDFQYFGFDSAHLVNAGFVGVSRADSLGALTHLVIQTGVHPS